MVEVFWSNASLSRTQFRNAFPRASLTEPGAAARGAGEGSLADSERRVATRRPFEHTSCAMIHERTVVSVGPRLTRLPRSRVS